MGLPKALMPRLRDDLVTAHQDCTDQRIDTNFSSALYGELQATVHVLKTIHVQSIDRTLEVFLQKRRLKLLCLL